MSYVTELKPVSDLDDQRRARNGECPVCDRSWSNCGRIQVKHASSELVIVQCYQCKSIFIFPPEAM